MDCGWSLDCNFFLTIYDLSFLEKLWKYTLANFKFVKNGWKRWIICQWNLCQRLALAYFCACQIVPLWILFLNKFKLKLFSWLISSHFLTNVEIEKRMKILPEYFQVWQPFCQDPDIGEAVQRPDELRWLRAGIWSGRRPSPRGSGTFSRSHRRSCFPESRSCGAGPRPKSERRAAKKH